jgi:shikimate dehydrogenase
MSASRAARLKIVPRAERPADCLAVRTLLGEARHEAGRLAAFAMGRAGAPSRLLAPSWGSWATYGAARAGAESAPGQFTASDLLEVHDVLRIDAGTRLTALIGAHVFGSPSPAMHRAASRDAGLDWRCLPLELDALEDGLPLASELGLAALAVTMPFKERAAARCHALDAPARACGAVNTVLVTHESWYGTNTDAPAVLACIGHVLAPAGARVAVLGAGGMGRAAAFALGQAGATVTLYNRTLARAQQAARALGVQARPLEQLAEGGWDLLVQATPLGSRGEEAIPAGWLTGRAVLDAAYAAQPTPLVLEASRRGLAVVDGLQLLAAQAALQVQRITGFLPERAALERTARHWLTERVRAYPRASSR